MYDPSDKVDEIRRREKERKEKNKLNQPDEMTDRMNAPKGAKIKRPDKKITERQGMFPKNFNFFDRKNKDLRRGMENHLPNLSVGVQDIPSAPDNREIFNPADDNQSAFLMDKAHDDAGSVKPKEYKDYGVKTVDELVGMSPEEVSRYQDALKSRGYDIKVDGITGEETIDTNRSYLNDLKNGKVKDAITPLTPKEAGIPKATKEEQALDVIQRAREARKSGLNPFVATLMDKPQWNKKKEKRLKNAGSWAAIGEAMRNVIDAAGGSQGADIWRHQNSPLAPITSSLQSMRQQYDSDMDDYEQAQRENAIRERGYEFKSGENQKDRDFKREQSRNQFGQQLQMLGAKTKAEQQTQLLEAEQRRQLDKLKNQDKKEYAKYKAQLDARLDDHYTNNDFSLALQKAAMDADKNSSEDGFFQVTNGNGQQVDIPEGTYYDIINRIMEDVNSGAITDDPDLNNDMSVLELALEGNGSKNALNIKVAQYYDKYYKQDPQTGKMVSRDYAQQQNTQTINNLQQTYEKAPDQSTAVKRMAAELIKSGKYERTEEGALKAKQAAQTLYERLSKDNPKRNGGGAGASKTPSTTIPNSNRL